MSGTLWLDEHARALIAHEAAKRPRLETGGALFGYEQDDHLVVACAYGPGPRAKHRRASFELVNALGDELACEDRQVASQVVRPPGLGVSVTGYL